MSYLGLSDEAFRCLRNMPAAGVESLGCDPITNEMLAARGFVRERGGRWFLTALGAALEDADRKLSEALFQKEFAGKAR